MTPEPKRPLKVFLCHAHADRDAVKALYARLTKDGVDAWLDKEKLLPGQDWELEIRKAVREADVVVVCLSKQFNQAGFRQKEVRLALDTAMEQPEGEIFIIPARLEECDTLESLRKWHWVDLFEEDGYEMLMRALRARANRSGATLQLKKGWLSKISSPSSTSQKGAPVSQSVVSERGGGQPDKQEDTTQEELQQEIDKRANNIKRSLKREIFISRLRNKLNLYLLYFRYYIFPAILLIAVVIATFYLAKPYLENGIPSATTPTSEQPVSPQPGPAIIETEIPSTEVVETVTPTPLPTEITDARGVSMVLVPAGEFMMGNDGGLPDQRPVHLVNLDAFLIDTYETSNALYRVCVNAGVCSPPYPRNAFDLQPDWPVTFVNWNQAKNYCQWRNAKLPTEAQWEKAARGTDERSFPWGEDIDCTKAAFMGCSR